MAKIPTHHGERWSPADVMKLRSLAGGNTPTRVIALKLGRKPGGVEAKADELNISLQPWNQSPYNRRTR